jgi:hypothetical protein
MPIGQPNLNIVPDKLSDIAENKPVVETPEQELEPAEVTQAVELTDMQGKSYQGIFILRVPTLADTLNIDRMKVRLSDGIPMSSLDPAAAAFFTALATCYVMFAQEPKDSGRIDAAPGWWHTMTTKELPPQLIWALYDALRGHAQRYFRFDPETGESTTGRCVVKLGERRGSN